MSCLQNKSFLIFYIINFYNRSTIWRISSHECVQNTCVSQSCSRSLNEDSNLVVPVCKIGRTRSISPVVHRILLQSRGKGPLKTLTFIKCDNVSAGYAYLHKTAQPQRKIKCVWAYGSAVLINSCILCRNFSGNMAHVCANYVPCSSLLQQMLTQRLLK